MPSFLVADVRSLRRDKYHPARVYRRHAGDAAAGAMEFLYDLFLFACHRTRCGHTLTLTTDVCFTDRLENEHLGNMDQYRVTREVPLPYSFEMHSNEEEEQEENEQENAHEQEQETRGRASGSGAWWKKRMARVRRNGGHG